MEEKGGEVVRDSQQLLQVSLSLLSDRCEGFRAMAHFHDTHTGALVVDKVGLGLLEDRSGQAAGSCGKVVDGLRFGHLCDLIG